MYDITPTIWTTSYTLYEASWPYFMRSHHIMYDITCIVFLTSLNLYMTLNPLYLCHQEQCINYTTPALCMTSHTLYVWHHSQYSWHHMNTLCRHTHILMSSQRVYLWHHKNIYDINATAFMKRQQLYLTSHPLYLTSQPVCLCLQHPLYCCHHNNYVSYPTWHMDDIIHTLHDLTITLYETIPQYLGHHSHCIHDIRSCTYEMTSRVYDISFAIPVTSETLCLWIHINNIYHQTHGAETIQPLCLKSQLPNVYLCDHTQCIHDLSHTVLMTWHLIYL